MNEYLKNPFQLTILFALLLPLAVWAEAKKPNVITSLPMTWDMEISPVMGRKNSRHPILIGWRKKGLSLPRITRAIPCALPVGQF